tara:strand:- start:20 stop:496 length:477 start_codon:yes stop_codon:yes gene_type:complete
MIKNICGCDFKYENDKMYKLNKHTKKWTCCNYNKSDNGYIRICINYKRYLLHRLIYKYHNEDWDITDISSNNQIDHYDINKSNNKIENLRILTCSQNTRNQKKRENTSSKYIGVFKSGNKWVAQIRIDGKNKHLGSYETEEEASEVYKKKCKELMPKY